MDSTHQINDDKIFEENDTNLNTENVIENVETEKSKREFFNASQNEIKEVLEENIDEQGILGESKQEVEKAQENKEEANELKETDERYTDPGNLNEERNDEIVVNEIQEKNAEEEQIKEDLVNPIVEEEKTQVHSEIHNDDAVFENNVEKVRNQLSFKIEEVSTPVFDEKTIENRVVEEASEDKPEFISNIEDVNEEQIKVDQIPITEEINQEKGLQVEKFEETHEVIVEKSEDKEEEKLKDTTDDKIEEKVEEKQSDEQPNVINVQVEENLVDHANDYQPEVVEIKVEESKIEIKEEAQELKQEEQINSENHLKETNNILLESETSNKQESTNVETEVKEASENVQNTNEIPQNDSNSTPETTKKVEPEIPVVEKESNGDNEKNVRESLHEKPLKELFDRMISFKKEGNKHINSLSKTAEEMYRKAIEEYETFSNNFNTKVLQGEEETTLWSKIEEERKLIFSNLALFFERSKLYDEAISTDFIIITELDKFWDKSYVRMIKCLVHKEELEKAVIYEQMFHKMFDDSTKKRHEEHFIILKSKLDEGRERLAKKEAEMKSSTTQPLKTQENAEKPKYPVKEPEVKVNFEKDNLNISNASQGSTLIENPDSKKEQKDADKQQVIKPSKKINWIKAVFGSMFFIGCATGFFMLMRYRNKFR